MLKKNKKLEVQPLKRAYRAKYPSYLDKNPLEYPDARPYPFSMKLIRAMSSAGFVGAMMLAPMAGCKTIDTKVQTSDGNPFPLSAANVPYSPVMFGTGAPSRVYGEEVIDFINKAFTAEGLTISKDTLISHEGVEVTVNAYNEKYNIGYIWMNYSNYGEGMTRNNFRRTTPYTQKEYVKDLQERMESNYEKYKEDIVKYLKRGFRGKDKLTKAHKKDLQEKLPQISSENDREKYFFKKYKSYHLAHAMENYKQRKLSEYVYNWQVDALGRFDDEIETLIVLQRFTDILRQYYEGGSQDLINALNLEVREIYRTESKKEWKKRSEALIDLLNIPYTSRGIQKQPEYLNVLTGIVKSKPWNKRKKQFYRLEQIIDTKYISYKEALQIQRASQSGDYFIAPISARDRRTIYRSPMGLYNPSYNEKLIVLRKNIKEADTEEQKDSLKILQNEIYAAQNAEEAKRTEEAKLKALKLLEADVRRYIRWAKSQQGY